MLRRLQVRARLAAGQVALHRCRLVYAAASEFLVHRRPDPIRCHRYRYPNHHRISVDSFFYPSFTKIDFNRPKP